MLELFSLGRPGAESYSRFRTTAAICICLASCAAAQEVTECGDFELPDHRGKTHSLSTVDRPLKVIAFLGTECPLAKLYSVRLNELADEFGKEIVVFAVDSNSQDSLTDIAAFVRRQDLSYPMLKDLNAGLADDLNAKRTPEVILLDEDNRIQYRGRIDDQYGVGYSRAEPTRNDLRIAIEELLSGKSVSIARTKPVGCFIGRPPKRMTSDEVTYAEHIAPLLEQHCLECHREGQIAPFTLTDYDEVIGWTETIREVVEQKRMPPWHADAKHGTFLNDRSMSEDDKRLLLKWIENGAPKGEDNGQPTKHIEDHKSNGWRLPRKPGLELAMGDPFQVPAEGVIEYQYFVVDPQFKEDKWVVGAEVIPGNREVVHHAIVFVRPPEGERQNGIGWLTAFVPGQSLIALDDGMARRIPKGSKLVFQLHYTPTGNVTEDQTKLGLIFGEAESIHTEVLTRIAINRTFEIPPSKPDHHVSMSIDGFPTGSRLLAIAPHMHFRGSKFTVTATGSSNQKKEGKILLHVPNYDFNWQHTYLLSKPLALANATIQCEAVFDNSEKNLANPDPAATVHWGDQTWEEMAMAYLAVAVPRNTTSSDQTSSSQAIVVEQSNSRDAKRRLTRKQREAFAQRYAKDFFARLDVNEDGEILRAETRVSFRAFAWRDFDKNDDDKLTWEEVLQQARLSQRP